MRQGRQTIVIMMTKPKPLTLSGFGVRDDDDGDDDDDHHDDDVVETVPGVDFFGRVRGKKSRTDSNMELLHPELEPLT